jgi:ferredoxin
MKACVDKSLCIGCGLCTAVCPEVFEMDDDGMAKAIEVEIPEKLSGSVEDAKTQCPVSAIKTE